MPDPPKTTLVAYADLGTQSAQTFSNLTEGLYKRDALHRTYARDVEAVDVPRSRIVTPIPLGNWFPKAMTGVSRYLWSDFDHRHWSERLFDTFASRSVEGFEDTIILAQVGLLRTIRAANDRGLGTAIFGTTELTRRASSRGRRAADELGFQVSGSGDVTSRERIRERSLHEADHIVALSSFIKRSYVESGLSEENITRIPLGVDTDHYTPGPATRAQDFRVLYVGHMSVLKGIPYLLQAWDRLGWDGNADATLTLCGATQGRFSNYLSQWSFQNLQLPGHVNPLQYYRGASVFVCPSLSDSFSKATLEAMSCGKPVIITENVGAKDLIEDGEEGFVVPPMDADALSEKLQYFRESPDEVERMGANAREKAEEYPWGRFVDNIADFTADLQRPEA